MQLKDLQQNIDILQNIDLLRYTDFLQNDFGKLRQIGPKTLLTQ